MFTDNNYLLLLEKIEATGDRRFVPLLEAWADIEYKKVRTAIKRVIAALDNLEKQ